VGGIALGLPLYVALATNLQLDILDSAEQTDLPDKVDPNLSARSEVAWKSGPASYVCTSCAFAAE